MRLATLAKFILCLIARERTCYLVPEEAAFTEVVSGAAHDVYGIAGRCSHTQSDCRQSNFHGRIWTQCGVVEVLISEK